MTYRHAVVWIDHHRATVIDFSVDDRHVAKLEAAAPQRLHRKSGPMGSGHAPDDVQLFRDVVAALGDAAEVVVTGPGTARTAFAKHVERHHPDLHVRITGVHPLDHPSDRELVAYARAWFRRVDALEGPEGRARG
jgi:stalled ribosome rescue protein Dom34